MMTDAIREALSATRDAWAEADAELPLDDADLKAAVLVGLDNAILDLEQALRLAGAAPDE